MADTIVQRDYEVSREAFREFGEWTRRFGSKVQETAIELAVGRGDPAFVTREVLAEAVRMTCESIVAGLVCYSPQGQPPNAERAKAA